MEEIRPDHHRLPMLLLTISKPNVRTRMLCNFTNGLGCPVYLGTKANEARTCCVGSSEGWVMVVDSNLGISLLNPISMAEIKLPPQPTFEHQRHSTTTITIPLHKTKNLHREDTPRKFKRINFPNNRYIHKIVSSPSSSSSSSSSSCVILAIYFEFRNLAFCKPGYASWVRVDAFGFNPIQDVIFYRGNFYALSHRGILLVCVLDDPVPRLKPIIDGPRNVATVLNKYLVNAFDEELLLVTRFAQVKKKRRNTTLWFKVYVLVQIEDESSSSSSSAGAAVSLPPFQWKKVTNLRNLALFVGRGSSMCFSADDHPGCRRNCIYFTDDRLYSQDVEVSDVGMFDYGEGKVEKLCSWPMPHHSLWPPIWVKPNY